MERRRKQRSKRTIGEDEEMEKRGKGKEERSGES